MNFFNFEETPDDDFDDLLGSPVPQSSKKAVESPLPIVKRGRPIGSRDTVKRRAPIPLLKPLIPEPVDDMDVEVTSGVTIPWLSTVFRMPLARVKELMRTARPVKVSSRGTKFYDIVEAAQFLVKPKLSTEEFLKTVRKTDLPDHLKESFWNAKLKEQKFRRLAGELWTTESVMNFIGETFKTIKNTTMLWSDTVESAHGITDEQRNTILELKDHLLEDLASSVKDQAAENTTLSQLGELAEPEDIEEVDDDEN